VWLTMATGPARTAGRSTNEANNPALVLTRPLQLGPHTRVAVRYVASTISACRAAPSGPASANPALAISTAGTALATHRRTASGTADAWSRMIAKSTAPGIAASEVNEGIPRISPGV